MAGRSSILVMVLALGVLFSALYFSANFASDNGKVVHDPQVIPTEPRISQLQTLDAAEKHIRAEVKNVQKIKLEFQMFNFSASEYNSVSAHRNEYVQYRQNMGNYWDLEHVKQYPELLNLRLFFHANGTVYAVNGTDHSYKKICDKPSTCIIGNAIATAAKDRLVYFADMLWYPSEIPNIGFIVIDAETRELVWTSLEYAKNIKPMPNVNFDNKTLSQLFRERADPPQNASIDIERGAAIQSTGKSYLPKEIRVTLGIDNRVIWTNRDDVPESVVSDRGYIDKITGEKFESRWILPNSEFEFVFTEPGEYSYHAEPHPWMQGKVIVLESFR